MKRIIAWTLSVLCILSVLALPAYAEEPDPATEALTEATTASESIAAETLTESSAAETLAESAAEGDAETTADTEGAAAVPLDEWMYTLLQAATPEQVQLMEGIVLGGMSALDKLEINGWDRVRVWVEHNMATVMVAALTLALTVFAVLAYLQKKGFAKKADILNANAIEMYEAGRASMEHAAKCCERALKAAEASEAKAKEAVALAEEERALMIRELKRDEAVNAALAETVYFLLQCSDLSQAKRDEAEAIFRRGREAMKYEANEQHEEA